MRACVAGPDDWDFFIETVQASGMSIEMAETLTDMGVLSFFICGNAGVVVCWQPPEAQFLAFHRKGSAEGFIGDVRQLLLLVRESAQRKGCTRFAAQIENANPLRARLLRFYERFIGLRPHAVVVRGDV